MVIARRGFLGACLCLLCGAAAARADSGAPAPALSAATQVIVDPATGQILPAPVGASEAVSIEHLRALVQNSTTEGLQIERRPDGAEVMNLQGRFQHAVVFQNNGDGTVTVACDLHGGHKLSLAAIKSLRSSALSPQP
jgi:hypothetical protein